MKAISRHFRGEIRRLRGKLFLQATPSDHPGAQSDHPTAPSDYLMCICCRFFLHKKLIKIGPWEAEIFAIQWEARFS